MFSGKKGSMVSGTRKIALVTGGSRGIGKGTALALAKNGFIVYITGRTIEDNSSKTNLPGTIFQTSKEIETAGGVCIPIQCDHTNDDQVKCVFQRIEEDEKRLDVLVNCVWGGYEHYFDGTEFWKEKGFWDMPFSRWDKMFDAGVRAQFVSSSFAKPIMENGKNGLIVNISYWAAEKKGMGVAYSVAKAATNKMTEVMAFELKSTSISVITLYPGLVRTESVMKAKEHFNLSNSESPEFTGLVISRMVEDANLPSMSGNRFTTAALAIEYGVRDIDGRQPIPLTIETA